MPQTDSVSMRILSAHLSDEHSSENDEIEGKASSCQGDFAIFVHG
jgi:hypothetical protein